ncbi:MAG: histidine kinase [Gemmatimonadota bacterium]
MMRTDDTSQIRHSRALWLLSFAVWTVIGLLSSGSEVIDVLTGDTNASIWEPVLWELSSTYTWALLTPFIVIFTLRHKFTRIRWPKVLPLHVLAMVLFSIAHVGTMVAIRKAAYWIVGDFYDFGNIGLETMYELFKDIVTFWTLVGFTYGFDYYRKYRARELQAAQLETQLAQVKLENLRQQLHPHFLFNTLNTISSIMHEDVRAADAIITRLSDLLRMAMDTGDRHEVPVQEEIEALQIYLEIMQSRFHDRLSVALSIDPEARDALVPLLILQPLVENAIKHAVASRPGGGGGRVFVTVERRNGSVRLEVRDDGPGSNETLEELLKKGFGLSSTIERLQQLYGDSQHSSVRNGPEGGFAVTLDLPYRRAASQGGISISE